MIGLVGGLGPAATVHYYLSLLAECERRTLQLRLLLNHGDLGKALAAAAPGARTELADHLSERMHELERAGAAVLAIAAVTPHVCVPELLPRLHAPFVDVVAALNDELQRREIDRIALIGTRITTTSRLFGRLTATSVQGSDTQVTRGHDLYVSIVREGDVSAATAHALGALAAEYVRQFDVAAVVLAGTELALVPKDAWDGINVVDCARLHIEAIVAAATPATHSI